MQNAEFRNARQGFAQILHSSFLILNLDKYGNNQRNLQRQSPQ